MAGARNFCDACSTSIAQRQAAAYRQHPEVQDTLAQGRALAPSIRIATFRNLDDREPPAELVAVRRDALRRDRQTRDRERDQAV